MSVKTKNSRKLRLYIGSLWPCLAFGLISVLFVTCSDNSTNTLKNSNPSREVWVEPDNCGKTVLGAIENAHYSVDISIYELGCPRILEALKTAKANEVDIRIMYNGQFFVGSNPSEQSYDQQYAVIDELTSAPGDGSVTFHWSSNNFNITHQKTILIDASKQGIALAAHDLGDSATALVMTLNLSAFAWKMSKYGGKCTDPCQFWGPGYPDNGKGTRDFGVVVKDAELIAEIAAVFDSDFACDGSSVTNDLRSGPTSWPQRRDGLVWSNGTTGLPGFEVGQYPTDGAYPDYDPDKSGTSIDQGNARKAHLAVIDSAKKTLDIYNEEMNDSEIVEHIVTVAKRGVKVRVIMTAQIKESDDSGKPYYDFYWNFDRICKAGGQVRLFLNTDEFMYIHAKVLLADANQSDAYAFVGSQNISGASLNFNRELGLMLLGRDTDVLFKTFEQDWNVKGLIDWPSDGPIFPSEDTTSAYKDEGLSSVIPSTELGHILNGENDVPMPCGTVQPR
jgi:phosphatidylserine/phosphatidylglycerophosphate/cardiolipin synthase-like enzyme